MSSMVSTLTVRLLDQVTGPAKKIASSLLGISSAASKSGGSLGFGARLNDAIRRNNRALSQFRGRLTDAVAGIYLLKSALAAPIANATEFESLLLDIAQKADLSDGAMQSLGKRVTGLSKDLGRSQAEIAGVMDNLMGRGMDDKTAEAAVSPIVKTAAAYRAAADDVASATFSVIDNLKVPVSELPKSLDIMSQAGKEGAFELKDMAAEFPSLTARAQALGMTGTKAVAQLSAALQIARKGAGTSGEAATNTANLMQKIISPETTKKFKKAGIDIRKELKKVQKEGGDIFEFIADATTRATGGDLSKLGDFFQDAQVQSFLIPLIQNLEEYRRIRDVSAKADKVVDADYARRQKTLAAQSTRFAASIERITSALGNALLPGINAVLDRVIPVIDQFAEWAALNPQLTTGITAAVAGLIAFRIALAGLRFVGLLGRGGALSALKIALKGLAGLKLSGSLVAWLGKIAASAVGIGAAAKGLESVSTSAKAAGAIPGGNTPPPAPAGKSPPINKPGIGRIGWSGLLIYDAITKAPSSPEESEANGNRLNKFFEDTIGTPQSWLGLKEPLIDTLMRGSEGKRGANEPGSEIAETRAQIAEIKQQMADANARKHPAMRDMFDPQQDLLETQKAQLEARVSSLEAQIAKATPEPVGETHGPNNVPTPGAKPANIPIPTARPDNAGDQSVTANTSATQGVTNEKTDTPSPTNTPAINVPIPGERPAEARASADTTMAAFNAGIDAGLDTAEARMTAWMQRMVGLMATSLTPVISPRLDMSAISGVHADVGVE